MNQLIYETKWHTIVNNLIVINVRSAKITVVNCFDSNHSGKLKFISVITTFTVKRVYCNLWALITQYITLSYVTYYVWVLITSPPIDHIVR